MDQEQVKKIAPWAVGGVLLLLLLNNGQRQQPAAGPVSPVPVPVAPVSPGVPSAEMQGLVASIVPLRAKNPQAATIMAQFYRAAADVVRRDDSRIKTTGQFRTSRIDANNLYAAKTPVVGTLGLGPPSDKAIADAIGLEDVGLDAAKRARLAEVLDAIAWALNGGR